MYSYLLLSRPFRPIRTFISVCEDRGLEAFVINMTCLGVTQPDHYPEVRLACVHDVSFEQDFHRKVDKLGQFGVSFSSGDIFR